MKKILITCLICLSTLLVNSAMVTIHFMTGYSLSPVNLKIYYGSQLQTYTNYIIASLSANNIVTTTYAAYD